MKVKGCARLVGSVLVLVVLGAASVSAKNSRNLKVMYPASLGGTQLAAGEYNVAWESHSPEATVSFIRGKNVVATAAAKWEQRDIKYARNSVVFDGDSDASRTIVEVRFAGMSQALVFTPTARP